MNSLHSCAASVLLCAMTSVGRFSFAIVLRDRERLARAGRAKQRLMHRAGLHAFGQLPDRFRLVALRRIIRFELEEPALLLLFNHKFATPRSYVFYEKAY